MGVTRERATVLAAYQWNTWCATRLKDEPGKVMVQLRIYRKVHAHLMFGLLVIFADQLLRLGV
ncbi:MAG: hypothetical protein BWY76_02515 [bacterium ADurb.Bin429]|nr:MAG: hypothetical protein BWY76_02515 [bacterium ADurb.Bin429]